MKEYQIDTYNRLLKKNNTIVLKEIENSGDFFREYGAFAQFMSADSACFIFNNRLIIHTQVYNNTCVLHATIIDAINNEFKLGLPAYKYNYNDELKLDDSTLNYFLLFRFHKSDVYLSEKYSPAIHRNWKLFIENKQYNSAYEEKMQKIKNYFNVLDNLNIKYNLSGQ